jgi:hypothetical protein
LTCETLNRSFNHEENPNMLKQLSRRRFDGFFAYEPGNKITGKIDAEIVTGENDQHKEKGFIAVLVDSPCKIKVDQADVVAELGQLIAISITNATRVLLGLPYGSRIEATFKGFSAAKGGHQFHDWEIFLDDGRPTS